ncbi:MAG TPA: HEAT repeat domain-containing protein [Candidatus Kapabacteria bacterium]|nr:HEAT repeat domain-containing protein [Candidatus Kapabacteria bacterium]
MTTTISSSLPASRPMVSALAAAVLALAATSLHAQYLPGYVMRGVDSALSSMAMTRADMSMRWDAAGTDPHRLSVIKRLFGDPLATFSVADSLASISLSNRKNYGALFNHLGKRLDFGDNAFVVQHPALSDNEIKLYSKVDISKLGLPDAFLLRKFLMLALATDASLTNVKGSIKAERLTRLIAYCDSLILQSEDDANATLLEMKESERYGLKRSKQFFNDDANGLDYQALLEPGVGLFSVAFDLAQNMAPEVARLKDSIKTQIWQTPLGVVALGGPGDDIYTGDLFCVIDVGGNDIYKPKPHTKRDAADRQVTLIVDFDGNDTYIGQDFAFGGTLFGASTVIDMKGDDSYTAGNFSLGCGYFGTGILYDGAGSDRYSGGTAVEGAGMFGIGLLIDAQGNDTYLAHFESQGFGYTRGIGAIIEHEGNDQYIASSPYVDFLRYADHFETFCQGAALGARPVASAGIGYIAEGSGNDTYVADIFGQGTGYWYGLGAIVDYGGNDSYSAYQYAQGAGVHLAFGALIDTSGDDNYVSHGVSQGCGHDVGFGGFYDAKGDDNYVVESLSQGGGNADAISLFIDGGGTDGYLARVNNTMGYSDLRNDYGMIGIFLDLEGKDYYGSIRGGNDSLWNGSFYGAGLDANLRPKSQDAPSTGPAEVKKTKEEIGAELGKDIPTLFTQASAAPQKFQYLVDTARWRLVERADESIPYLLGMMNTELPRERLAIDVIFPRIGKRMLKPLMDTVAMGAPERVGRALYSLGEIRDTTAAEVIGRKLVDPKATWRMRAAAGQALLKIKAPSAKPYLKMALRDTVELVRGYAARAMVLVADSTELNEIMSAMNDRSQVVRHQVQLALQNRGVDSVDVSRAIVHSMLENQSGFSFTLLYQLALTMHDSTGRSQLLSGLLANPSPTIRAKAVRLVLAWSDPDLLDMARALKKSEKNSMVLFELNKIPESPKKKKSRHR